MPPPDGHRRRAVYTWTDMVYTVVSYDTPKSASNEAVRDGYRVDRGSGSYRRNPESAAVCVTDFGIRRLCYRPVGGGQLFTCR